MREIVPVKLMKNKFSVKSKEAMKVNVWIYLVMSSICHTSVISNFVILPSASLSTLYLIFSIDY